MDTTFGTANTGLVMTEFDSSFGTYWSGANAITVLPDDRLVLAGYAGANMAVVRYTADGELDTTFDGDDRATVAFGTPCRVGFIPPSGLILKPRGGMNPALHLAGSTTAGAVTMACLNDDRSTDRTFGTGGLVTTSFSSGHDIVPDGAILVAGEADGDFALARYSSAVVSLSSAAPDPRLYYLHDANWSRQWYARTQLIEVEVGHKIRPATDAEFDALKRLADGRRK